MIDPSMEPEQDDTTTTREELAALVRRPPTERAETEPFMRQSHQLAAEHLAELRARRDELQSQIAEAVEVEELYRRVVAVFDRARAKS